MENISREQAWEIVKEHLASSDIYQKEIGIMLGLEKYDVSKVLHGKRKLYLHEFLMLANALNLTSPNKEKAYLEKIEELENKLEDKKKEYTAYFNEQQEELKEKDDKIKELHSQIEDKTQNSYDALLAYFEDENSESLVETLDDLVQRLEKALEEGESMFSPATFIDYQRLKNNEYLLENQYVFNLDELKRDNSDEKS